MKSIYTDAYQLLILSIQEARINSGKTQAEVAAKLGRHQSFIAKIEKGERRIDLIEFLQIAKIISLDTHILVASIEKRLG